MNLKIFAILIILFLTVGCLEDNKGPKGAGSSCIDDSECYEGVSCIFNEKNNFSVCDCSGEGIKCLSEDDCCKGLACRDEKCITLPVYCELRGVRGISLLIGIISAMVGIVFTGLGLGGKQKLIIERGKVTFIGFGVTLVVIGIIMILFSFILLNTC